MIKIQSKFKKTSLEKILMSNFTHKEEEKLKILK